MRSLVGDGAGQTVLRAHAIAAAEQKSLKRAGRRSGGRGRSRLSQQGAGIRGVFSPLVLHVHCPYVLHLIFSLL